MKKAAEVFGRAPKGVKPNMDGVAGRVVKAADLPAGLAETLIFVARNNKVSPYDAPLRELAEATKANGPGAFLEFGDVRARVSVAVRARKLGFRVSFATANGKLYVRFDGLLAGDLKGSRREKILAALKNGTQTAHKINIAVRDSGDTTFDAQTAEVILATLMREGYVIAREGGTWALNPRSTVRGGVAA